MSEFNFKSSVCTSRSQSEKLLALGLKKETRDAVLKKYIHNDKYCYKPVFEDIDDRLIDCNDLYPAWSLDRLREMLNKSGVTISFVERDTSIIVERYGVFQNLCEIWDNVYDNICNAYQWLIKEGYFNKEYLNETTED